MMFLACEHYGWKRSQYFKDIVCINDTVSYFVSSNETIALIILLSEKNAAHKTVAGCLCDGRGDI